MEDSLKESRRQIMQSTLELETKALNYLLVANGAGMAGCLTALKDYATVPQLHGLGVLIVIFSGGLITGTLGFLSFQSANFDVMRAVLVRDEPPQQATGTMALTNIAMKLSGACFLVAVIVIAVRLASL
jgi:hypothetical protein